MTPEQIDKIKPEDLYEELVKAHERIRELERRGTFSVERARPDSSHGFKHDWKAEATAKNGRIMVSYFINEEDAWKEVARFLRSNNAK